MKKQRLFDERYGHNTSGRKVQRDVKAALGPLIKKWRKRGYDLHDCERVVIYAIGTELAIERLFAGCGGRTRGRKPHVTKEKKK